MKLHFDSNQSYQWDTVKSITDIFEGQLLSSGDFEFTQTTTGSFLSENGFGNNLTLSVEQIFENVKTIDSIISAQPKKVIILDNLFTGNDQLKTNTVLQMRDAGIEFKTI